MLEIKHNGTETTAIFSLFKIYTLYTRPKNLERDRGGNEIKGEMYR